MIKNKHIFSKITRSRIKRMHTPIPPPIICFAHVTGNTNTNCDCINFCKHSNLPFKPATSINVWPSPFTIFNGVPKSFINSIAGKCASSIATCNRECCLKLTSESNGKSNFFTLFESSEKFLDSEQKFLSIIA